MRIQIIPHPEHLPIRGHCMASGDPVMDEAVANGIERRLIAGDIWAWCCVEVRATTADGWTKSEFLGCCSYKDEEDFRKGGYFDDMVAELSR